MAKSKREKKEGDSQEASEPKEVSDVSAALKKMAENEGAVQPESQEANPENGLPFDPEKEITKDDWQELKTELKENRKAKDWYGFSCTAMNMKILDPKIDIGLDRAAKQGMKSELENPRDREFQDVESYKWSKFAHQAAAMKILDPEMDLGLTKAQWQEMNDLLKDKSEWVDFCSLAVDMKILDPKLDPEMDLGLDQDVRQKLRDYVDHHKKTQGHALYSSEFFELAAKVKILDPEIDLGLDQAAWQRMRKHLRIRETRIAHKPLVYQPSADKFASQAAAMKILAAEKVEITDNGLEITMPESREK